MFIDPHVHFRDGKQAYKETVQHGLSVAEKAGFTAVFDMPNTDPPILTEKLAKERITKAKDANSQVWYGLYMGITPDKNQIQEAVQSHKTIDEIVGFKLYAGHSIGTLGVVHEEKQQFCYRELAKEGYKGVLVVHCEKEALIDRSKFDPEKPWTHCIAQPPEAEIESVKDTIRDARNAGYEGVLHIAHTSTPGAVELVKDAKAYLNITCGVVPDHLFNCEEDMHFSDGLLKKMNPAVRPIEMMWKMQEKLKAGDIDWIETDHAPHTLKEKTEKPYLSGTPGLPFYPHVINWMVDKGFDEKQIAALTFNNAKRTFGNKTAHLEPRVCTPNLHLASEYEYDPFKSA